MLNKCHSKYSKDFEDNGGFETLDQAMKRQEALAKSKGVSQAFIDDGGF